MAWTTDDPTTPGWYWLRWQESPGEPTTWRHTLVKIGAGACGLALVGCEATCHLDTLLEELADNRQWQGPLTPAEE